MCEKTEYPGRAVYLQRPPKRFPATGESLLLLLVYNDTFNAIHVFFRTFLVAVVSS